MNPDTVLSIQMTSFLLHVLPQVGYFLLLEKEIERDKEEKTERERERERD